jgi:adenylate kinase family enzyme
MRRVCVIGNSGSGKTSLAAALAVRIDAPHLELDSVFHQADWQPLPEEEFRGRVDEFTSADRWVVDGNYRKVRDLVWGRADTIVVLDLPRSVVTRQIVARSARRAIGRQELWNGNRERWSFLLSTDPERSVIAWSITQHQVYRDMYADLEHDPQWSHAEIVRLRSRREVHDFLATA